MEMVLLLGAAAFCVAASVVGCGGGGGGQPGGVSATGPAARVSGKVKPKRVPGPRPEELEKARLVKTAGIERIKTYEYPKFDGKPAKQPRLKREEVFDPDGFPLEETNYRDDGKIMSRWTYSYADQRQVGSRFYWGTTLQKEHRKTYDQEGRVVESVENDLEEKRTTTKRFTFNAAGDLTEEFSVEKDERKTYTFDAEGRETEVSYRSGDGRVRIIARKVYDAAGNLSEVQYPLADGYSCWKFTYDERGNQTGFRDQDMDGSVEWKLSAYDARNRLTEETRYKEGEEERTRTVLTYDDADRTTSRAAFTNDRLTWKVEYRYDAQGRPVEETRFGADGKVEARTTRTFGPHGLLAEERVTDKSGAVTDLTRYTFILRKP
ncbi:MAG: hypothetical protein GX442_21490 [Candidatus Riflebacteria bacterium]|nr:hypothetical protein [Candidatus Riflebacteria bacterium]